MYRTFPPFHRPVHTHIYTPVAHTTAVLVQHLAGTASNMPDVLLASDGTHGAFCGRVGCVNCCTLSTARMWVCAALRSLASTLPKLRFLCCMILHLMTSQRQVQFRPRTHGSMVCTAQPSMHPAQASFLCCMGCASYDVTTASAVPPQDAWEHVLHC